MAFLLGTTLGLVLRACGGDDARPMASGEAIAAYDSTLATELNQWRAEAEAAAVRAESLAAKVQWWQTEAERRQRAWVAARQRLDELDEVRDELDAMELDSLGALAGAVLRRRIGDRSVGR
jgi:predicted trehalose synthase